MKTYHHNSEYWYECNWSLFHRVRHWVIWIGGWEKANGKGWELFRKYGRRWRLVDPTPVSLFGHRVTFLGHGGHIRLPRTYLVWSRAGHPLCIYLSPDGTTARATTWIYNAPHEVKSKARIP
jgi:hypothetical protein